VSSCQGRQGEVGRVSSDLNDMSMIDSNAELRSASLTVAVINSLQIEPVLRVKPTLARAPGNATIFAPSDQTDTRSGSRDLAAEGARAWMRRNRC
jgi:hypothetical protein